MSVLTLATIIILVALLFDFVNGFHDSANSTATIVATRVLSPVTAVIWAAIFNFFAALLLGTGVASTVGNGFVDIDTVTPYVILAGLIGAILWDLFTWYLALPTSSSHALIGGYAGAAFAKAGWHGLVAGKWAATLAFIVLSPLIGLFLAYVLMIIVYWAFRHSTPAQMDRRFRHFQLASAALLSCAHGSNDAQKTMGIITAVLVSAGFQAGFHVPTWVILASGTAIGLG